MKKTDDDCTEHDGRQVPGSVPTIGQLSTYDDLQVAELHGQAPQRLPAGSGRAHRIRLRHASIAFLAGDRKKLLKSFKIVKNR
jgi:hypothetical protein